MITELSIRNFAIIDEMKISFAEGLNVITGETGAGKSILIGAMSLLLGERASVDIIRSHEDSAMVEAFFEIEGRNDLKEMLKEMGFHVGNELILKRIISRTGKNRVFVDGQLATLGMLSAISTSLVNICGQHEHQIILNAEKHIDILDNFGDLEQLRSEYTELYNQYLALSGKLRQLLEVNKTREERGEFLRFHLKEIEDAGIRIGEDDQLQEEKRVLNNVQKLLEYADGAHDVLYGKAGSVLEGLRSINSNVREIKKIDRTLSLSEKDLDAVYYQLEEAALALRNYKKNLSYDPTRLEAIDDRLELLSRLKRKYGRTLEDVLQKKTEIEQELKTIDSVDEEIDLLLAEVEDLKANMLGKAQMLSARRRETAALLKKEIEEEIHALRMEKATFEVMFAEATPDQGGLPFHSRGVDQVEFYLTTNVGEVPKPLNRIASGGELSRIMLAMKKVLAGTGSVGTLVFDEVDSGIGGATAEDVGRKLSDASKDHQVLCITHLPQIACFGDRHYRVSKTVVGEKTVTSVDVLSEDERLNEITRMLGGTELTEKTREHAREMLVMSRVKK
ncbi:MAG: DNA repair protein RecN [Deltaproteobacteria bacterium]|nr:DNA repair protein RecN [Deltaproteobacteria bacterium]